MSQSLYKDGEIVWVKWGNSWWPGEVWGPTRVPEDILSSLRKPVIAFVKFLQEDSFEFVRSPNSISTYNCEKKMEYIKKGMDKYRSNNKIMQNFPADVVKAEQMTGGNPNILDAVETKTSTSTKVKTSTNVGISASPDTTKKTFQLTSTSTNSTTTKKSAGSYNSSVKVQNTTSAVQKLNDKKLTCTMCSFSTDRMNLLMMHIKNHSLNILSRVNSPSSSSSETRKSIVSRNSSKKSDADDGIAEDVRKIKESMKELVQQQTPVVTKKARTPTAKKDEKNTPKTKVAKRERKSNIKDLKEDILEISVQPTEVDDKKTKSYDTLGLKNELLADWLDDEDIGIDKIEEKKILAAPTAIIDNISRTSVGESSRSIRNIPKKQRVSEIYIQPQSTNESNSNVEKLLSNINSSIADNENVKKNQKESKRKRVSSDFLIGPEKKKLLEEKEDNKLLMATAELLNDTEVPKSSSSNTTESPSTFQKSNDIDIDKRYLPPKERNKRIFRDSTVPHTVMLPSTALATEDKINEKNGKDKVIEDIELKNFVDNDETKMHISSSIVSKTELILPHKKKQSSRLLTEIEKHTSPVRETRNNRETPLKSEQTFTNARSKRYRKSNDSQSLIDSNVSKDITAKINIEESTSNFSAQSPLRETEDVNDELKKSTNLNRSLKRRRSCDSPVKELKIESNKIHKSDSPQPQPRTIVVACASETICITSKGTISVAHRDSIKTTCSNSVVVTSHVIISEALSKQPIVTSKISTTDTTASPKKSILPSVSLPPQQQIPKNALKIPKENIEEMKKQGLVTVENNRTKLTPKGRQKFKEFQDEQSSSLASTTSSSSSCGPQTLSPKSIETYEFTLIKSDENSRTVNDKLTPNTEVQLESKSINTEQENVEMQEEKEEETKSIKEICEQDENDNETNQSEATKQQIVELAFEEKEIEIESDSKKIVAETEKNDSVIIEKLNESTNLDEKDKYTENGNDNGENEEKEKDVEVDTDVPIEDASSGGAGLIALQAETFGGPPNCFYLCRPVEGGYEPVDNQILVLNAQNALVPYDGEIVTETVQENLSAYSQLSPNSNIIINTPNGQKIELSHYAIMALQEQADENGIASVELSGEQLELNINGILEAIQAQQQDSIESGEVLSAVLIGEGSDVPLIIESNELPVEMQVRDPSVATQVSETLSKPIMSTTIAPEIAKNSSKTTITESVSKNLNIEDSLASIGVKAAQRANVPKSLELPITVTNPTIAETVNHRKLTTSILGTEVVSESFVVQHADNGTVED